MKNKKLWIIVILVMIIVVPASLFYVSKHMMGSSSNSSLAPTPQNPEANVSITRTYSGTLPCADCKGIDTDLSLTQKDINTVEGSFVMSQMYLGKSSDVSISKGDWVTQKGDNSDPGATVIVLNPKDSEKIEYYLQVDPSHLEKLDKSGVKIEGSGNYILTLQK